GPVGAVVPAGKAGNGHGGLAAETLVVHEDRRREDVGGRGRRARAASVAAGAEVVGEDGRAWHEVEWVGSGSSAARQGEHERHEAEEDAPSGAGRSHFSPLPRPPGVRGRKEHGELHGYRQKKQPLNRVVLSRALTD